jgi:hypothetical protein
MSLIPSSGPFRISAPSASRKAAAAPQQGPQPPNGGDEYLQRLVKLVPSEVLALYISFKEVASTWLGIWAAICLVLVLFVRTVGTRQAGKPIQAIAVVVAMISFILWVYATGGYLFNLPLPSKTPGIISVAVGVWTFLIPYLYKGD